MPDELPIPRLAVAAQEAARVGGEQLIKWAGRFQTREKSPANLVTEADLASQDAIYAVLHGQFPDHRYLGEEDLNQTAGDSPYRWIIDPLDGTGNYVHGFPYYAVSIGVEWNGRLIAGAVFDPTRNEMFSAALGRGAFMNGQPIRPTPTSQLSDALCVASLPPHAGATHLAVQRFVRLLQEAQSVQRTGSAALNLCYTAIGRIDAFWSSSLKPWDMAAGALIVREAGGWISQIDGAEFRVDEPEILASNGTALHSQLIARLGAEA